MAQQHVLLVEDDPVLGKATRRGLLDAGFECTLAPSAEAGLVSYGTGSFDAIVLDLMLPQKSGLEFLKEVRQAGSRIPVLILTAMGSIPDRIEGLNQGADDYMSKPFDIAELVARVTAVCRRSQMVPGNTIEFGQLKLHLTTRKAFREGKEIPLTPTELSLLELLMRHAGTVITRKMLCEHLWDASWEGMTNVVEVHINRLRNKVDRDFPQPLIHTVRGRGYLLRGT